MWPEHGPMKQAFSLDSELDQAYVIEKLWANLDLPYNDYYDYFSPTYTLTVPSNNMENLNSREYLHKIMSIVLENIKRTGTNHAPSVQMQNVPRDREDDGSEEEERREMEERRRDNKIGKLWHNGSISTMAMDVD
jgi:hypothetical protein